MQLTVRMKFWTAFLVLGMCLEASAAPADDARADRIKIEYVQPTNPQQQQIYDMLRNRGVLEKLQQVFSPFKLPLDLAIKTTTCGEVNAWYERLNMTPVVTICYEYIEDIRVPKETTPAGITPSDAAIGQFFYVAVHELGHAMFDLLDVPLFGRPEDAADQFAAYIMLRFGKEQARRLIGGAAYSYHQDMLNVAPASLKMYSDVHGTPQQRFYNLLCMAYGADQTSFADLVDKGYLPENRARRCKKDFNEVVFAFEHLIRPHVDAEMAKRVLSTEYLPKEGAKRGL
jgi:hypothetical protein